MSKEDLIQYLEPFGQEHLLNFWDELNEEQKYQLLNDIDQVNIPEINTSYDYIKAESSQLTKQVDSSIKPIPEEIKGSVEKSSPQELNNYESEGLRAIGENQVAVLLLAGGQGTRLGVNYPKGMYSVGLLSGKSLYQLQAERLIKLKQLAGGKETDRNRSSIPLYIMASEHTLETTRNFFESNDYFGLDKENVVMFEQGNLPCLTRDGKIILDQKHRLSKAPDGNGGLYKALRTQGILDDMRSRSIKYIHAYCVDNILVNVADPVFVGFCIQQQADCAAKVVKKKFPEEKVGIICKVEDKFQVVEYSEISETIKNQRTNDDELVYDAANICNHFYSFDFLQRVSTVDENKLKYHRADKKIAYVDENGERIQPKQSNGIKLEKFVFDVFPFCEKFAIWEVPRKDEFSPLKNSDSDPTDSPTTCRDDLYAQHVKWLRKAGAIIKNDQSTFEISPLVSYKGEDLASIVSGRVLHGPLRIDLDLHKNVVTFNGIPIEND